jgi:PAS domain S-box-containing protein
MDSGLIDTRQQPKSEHRDREPSERIADPRNAVFCSFVLFPDGRSYFLHAGPEIAELFGIDPEKLKRSSGELRNLVYPDDLAVLRKSLTESARNLSQWHSEFRILHPGKGCRWIESHFAPTLGSDGSVVWTGLHFDFTERKLWEADQEFLLSLGTELQSAGSAEAIVRVATHMLGNYLAVDRCTLSTIDVPLNEVVLVSEYPARPPDPSSIRPHPLNIWADAAFIGAVASGIPVAIADTAVDPITADYYLTAFQPAGIGALIVIPLRRAGEWLAALSLMGPEPRIWSRREMDLARAAGERIWPAYDTARALASERSLHEALAAGEERLRLALRSAAIGIWESDPVTGERNWDARSREIFGFPPHLKITAETILSCIHPEDRELVRESIQQYTNPDGDGHFQIEHRILTWSEGALRFVYGQGQTIFQGGGAARKAVRSVGTLQDITALKQGEQTLRRMNQELEQFAYAAAHDLQEPLRCTGLAAQMLAFRYRGQLDPEADELLKTASEGTLRMQAMVRGLLTFSRAIDPGVGPLVPVNSNLALSSALENLEVAIRESHAQISCEALPPVRMPESQLIQIFQNLIGNAIKYSGGKQPLIRIFSQRRKGVRLFCVSDNGIGISPEYHERVFGIFKRLHREDIPGTGMGLALCRRIIEFYGGKIWIESAANEGATVLFSPPVADERTS